jgi:hypothetical protein
VLSQRGQCSSGVAGGSSLVHLHGESCPKSLRGRTPRTNGFEPADRRRLVRDPRTGEAPACPEPSAPPQASESISPGTRPATLRAGGLASADVGGRIRGRPRRGRGPRSGGFPVERAFPARRAGRRPRGRRAPVACRANTLPAKIAHANARRFAGGRLPRSVPDPVGKSDREFERRTRKSHAASGSSICVSSASPRTEPGDRRQSARPLRASGIVRRRILKSSHSEKFSM